MKLSKAKSCAIKQTNGKQYSIFVPNSNKQTSEILDNLNNHFDHVLVTQVECNDKEQDDDCSAGIEVAAIRAGSTNITEQDFEDMNNILKIVNPPIRGEERPILLSAGKGIKVYNNQEPKTG